MCQREPMQQAFGMTVPVTPSEMCHPSRAALLVYDAQVGILPAVQEREAVTDRMTAVLGAVRAAGMPVLYTRHVSLPPFLMGVGALRTAMAWQRVASADQVRQPFPPNGPQTQLVPELGPDGGEPVLDKLGMSAFVGTPLEMVLRDRGVATLVLVGAVLEIGIEPTARHAADLGFLPVIVEDACAVVDRDAADRCLASLDYSLLTYRISTAELLRAVAREPKS